MKLKHVARLVSTCFWRLKKCLGKTTYQWKIKCHKPRYREEDHHFLRNGVIHNFQKQGPVLHFQQTVLLGLINYWDAVQMNISYDVTNIIGAGNMQVSRNYTLITSVMKNKGVTNEWSQLHRSSALWRCQEKKDEVPRVSCEDYFFFFKKPLINVF